MNNYANSWKFVTNMMHYYSGSCTCGTCTPYLTNCVTTSTTAGLTAWPSIQMSVSTTSNSTDVTIPIPMQGRPKGRKEPEYRPPPREFNRYINASDLLEEFISFLGVEGVKQREVMDMPLQLFIQWLIIRAHEADGEKPPIQLALPEPKKAHRCLGCGKYMKKELPPIHDLRCATRYFSRPMRGVPVHANGVYNWAASTLPTRS